jgi:tetratricopeptide (TPR) repeat protein/tRNA A-37 threonylcarbamoyl transferase component Bud32
MDAQRWQLVAAIFDQVVELPPIERARTLERACNGDTTLRSAVDALLRHDATLDADIPALHAPCHVAADWVDEQEASARRDPAGLRIGPWRVLREIGRGGMGMVYLAERADGQYEQRAAVKVIRASGDPRALRRRFLRERQILARLEHPHIARLLDGGLAADGNPYFAMEYLDGRPLLAWVRERAADRSLRLRLFEDVCAAVQFAHRQLVVHLDIKPSNVLVTADGEVKLLDFGIATLLDAASAMDTQTRVHPLTPAYAAPEQLRGESVSTTTDVYALGVLLHELLTGVRPYGFRDDASPLACLRMMEGPPCALPSSTIARRPRVADVKVHSVPPVAAAFMRGDLDLIVLKALRRETDRRYPSVDALAEDLRRFHAGLPIRARRGSLRYRIGKFVLRHRAAVAVVMVTLLAVLAVLDIALIQARRANLAAELAEHQAGRAEAVKNFLMETFRSAEAGSVSGGYRFGVKQAVDIGARRLDIQFAKQPELAAEFALVLGEVYHDLGDYGASISILERARQWHARIPGRTDAGLADILSGLAKAQAGKGDYAAANASIRESIRLDEHDGGRRTRRSARDLAIAAEVFIGTGEYGEAERLLDEALAIAREQLPDDDSQITHILSDRARLLASTGRNEEALSTMNDVLAREQREHGEQSLDAAIAMTGLAEARAATHRLEEAIPLQRESAAIHRRLLPPNHPLVVAAISALANFELRARRHADAERDYREALVLARQTLGENNPATAALIASLAHERYEVGDFAEAAALEREIIAVFSALGTDAGPHATAARGNLGMALRELGEYAQAESLLRRALADRQRTLGERSGFVAAGLDQLAVLLRMTGRAREALALHAQAQTIYADRPNTSPHERGTSLCLLAETERSLHDLDHALAHVDDALGLLHEQVPPDDDAIADAGIVKGRILIENRHSAECEPVLRQALDQTTRSWGDSHWRVAAARSALGMCLLARGRSAEAGVLLARAQAALELTRGRTFPLTIETRRALAAR